MTAEICVMNKLGVALAADSAISVGDSNSTKIYNSANKVFSINDSIGIMVYGNAHFLGIPWETIINIYKETSLKENFETLETASEAFINFLKENSNLYNEESEFKHNFSIIQYFIEEIVENELSDLIVNGIVTNEDDYEKAREAFKNIISRKKNELENFNSSIPQSNLHDQFIEEYEEMIIHYLKETLYFECDEEIIKLVIDFSFLVMIKEVFLPGFVTGIVITGFGTADFFPKLYEHVISGSFFGNLKVMDRNPIIIGNKYKTATAAIRPFAQEDMVFTFMNGIDEGLLDEIPYMLNQAISMKFEETFFEKLSSSYDSDTINELKISFIDEITKNMQEMVTEFTYENFRMPILKILEDLPKEELASMAETLVNLTSFKRKVSMDVENVGGPIDVALITKGEGFIWIKRKHYFKKDLNQDYYIRKQRRQLDY